MTPENEALIAEAGAWANDPWPIIDEDWEKIVEKADSYILKLITALRAADEREWELVEALTQAVNHLDGFIALETRRKVGQNWVSEGRAFPSSNQIATARTVANIARKALRGKS